MAQLETKITVGKTTRPHTYVTLARGDVSTKDMDILETAFTSGDGSVDLQTEYGLWKFRITAVNDFDLYRLESSGPPRQSIGSAQTS